MPSVAMANIADGPVVKRQKLDKAKQSTQAYASRIFTPYRTFGLISPTAVPFTSIPLGKTTFQITTSVGRSLQTYDLKRGLNLVFLTRPQTPEEITSTLAWKDKVFAAWHGASNDKRPGIWVFKRGKKVDELEIPDDLTQPIRQILIFGTWIVGCCSTRIEVWKSTTYEHYTTLYPTASQKGGNELTGGICNVPTFLNKILAGRKDGGVEIWNVSTAKRVYTILPPASDCGAVTAMQPTPALSLVVIAYSGGPLIIHNILSDKTVMALHNSSSDATISSISFRTDGYGAGDDGRSSGVMATSSHENGDVTFWDLNKGGRVMGVLRGAHNPPAVEGVTVGGGVSKVEFLPGQPVIMTSGLDNSLKSWIFDETPFSPIPRILHSRSGHAAPVTRLQFLPTDSDGADAGGKWLLSSAHDRSLWAWSLRKDGQSTELSQGNIRKKAKKLGILAAGSLIKEPSTTLEELKAPEIICMASSLNRDGGMGAYAGGGEIWQKGKQPQNGKTDAALSGSTGWESVVTGHRGDKYARTWFWGRKKAGRWAFETGDGANVSSVAISPCGTFAVVGSEAGGIDMYNLQSGLHRKRFPSKLTPAQARKLKMDIAAQGGDLEIRGAKGKTYPPGLGRHTGSVTGLMVDSMNKHIISSSLDGTVKFWDFASGNHVAEIDAFADSGITALQYHAPSDLIALSTESNAIYVVDMETRKVVRELWGCTDTINDFCFSKDGRWIIAASKDRVLRVWDLPTGHLIDAIRTRSPCTALAFSGTGEFLATSCEGELGINVWNNKTLFTRMPTKHISEAEIADYTVTSEERSQGLLEAAFDDDEEEDLDDGVAAQPLEQLSKDMMTLSLVPKSRWQTLLHLDLIKQRNKPKEAPKAPEKAPFFLPSLENGKPSFHIDSPSDDKGAGDQSRVLKMDRFASEGQFTMLLRESAVNGDYIPFTEHLKSLPPSQTDLEIRSLSLSPIDSSPSGASELVVFVNALTDLLHQKRDYELVQAWMAVFLRVHADVTSSDAGLLDALAAWRQAQEKEAKRLGELVGWCTGVVGFVRSARR